MFVVDPNIQMWVTLAVIGAALVLYALERTPMEVTALGVLGVLLVLFYVFPLPGPDGANVLDAPRLLEGFANPALITVLALLVIGQGLVRQRRALMKLGDRLLRDIGISRAQAVAEAAKPFWRE